ncbi:MAG: DedA family protein [Candidatus Hydrogenedentes bacterium]|nr:DedA family protein [Candidatus Hydrogenedentota bacterium]
MVEHISYFITACMEVLGYPGLVIMMALESMIAPVPSEIVMCFAGFLVVQGRFSVWGAIIASSAGTLLGSLIGYYMGKFGGYPFVHRLGKYLLLEPHHLQTTARWFETRGDLTVFICRFVPVVRHLISIPAGVGNMNLFRFSLFTLVGGTMWNGVLLFAGVKLGQRWELIHHYSHEIDYVFVAAILVVGVWWVRKQWRKRKSSELRVPSE